MKKKTIQPLPVGGEYLSEGHEQEFETPSPTAPPKPFEAGNVVWDLYREKFGVILSFYTAPCATDNRTESRIECAMLRYKNGTTHGRDLGRLTHASDAQVDRYYTCEIDERKIRVYKFNGEFYIVGDDSVDILSLDTRIFSHALIMHLINEHKYPVQKVDEVGKMKVPTE